MKRLKTIFKNTINKVKDFASKNFKKYKKFIFSGAGLTMIIFVLSDLSRLKDIIHKNAFLMSILNIIKNILKNI